MCVIFFKRGLFQKQGRINKHANVSKVLITSYTKAVKFTGEHDVTDLKETQPVFLNKNNKSQISSAAHFNAI